MICVNECYNMDCADGMREMLEQGMRADWLITDPPYGIGWTKMTGGGDNLARNRDYGKREWDNQRIGKECFRLMFEVSDKQLIFGGNYYTDLLPATKSWCVWDKRCNDNNRSDFADCELAWVSEGGGESFQVFISRDAAGRHEEQRRALSSHTKTDSALGKDSQFLHARKRLNP